MAESVPELGSIPWNRIYSSAEERSTFEDDNGNFWEALRSEMDLETVTLLEMVWDSWGAPTSWSASLALERVGNLGLVWEWMEDRYVEAADSDDPEKRRWLPPDSMVAVVDPWDSGDAQKWIVLDYLSNPSKIMMNGESSGPFRPPTELTSDVPLSRHELFVALTRWDDKGFAKELVLELSRVLDEDMSDFIDELSKALGMEIEDLD